MVKPLSKIAWQVIKKLNMLLTVIPAFPLLVFIQKKQKRMSTQNLVHKHSQQTDSQQPVDLKVAGGLKGGLKGGQCSCLGVILSS